MKIWKNLLDRSSEFFEAAARVHFNKKIGTGPEYLWCPLQYAAFVPFDVDVEDLRRPVAARQFINGARFNFHRRGICVPVRDHVLRKGRYPDLSLTAAWRIWSSSTWFKRLLTLATSAACPFASMATTFPLGPTIFDSTRAMIPWCAPKLKTHAPGLRWWVCKSAISGIRGYSRLYQSSDVVSAMMNRNSKPW